MLSCGVCERMHDRVLCCVTRDRCEILVSQSADDAATQRVPTIDVEEGRPTEATAVRAIRERTGLADLRAGEWISSGPVVWFEALHSAPDAWTHGGALMKFVPLESVLRDSSVAEHLSRLCDRLACDDVAICYITRGTEILVFDGHPGGGVQVAAGKVEAGETPDQAAIREAFEEAGLGLTGGRFLGTQEWHHRGQSDVHEFRHYYWFRYETGRDAWQHRVSAGEADAGRIYRHRFTPAASARIDWDLDTYLPVLLDRLTKA